MKKRNLYYIDESGVILNKDKLFLYGCIKTDSPDDIESFFVSLKEFLLNQAYFENVRQDLLNRNFHAVDDHFDVRTRIYEKLPLLNFRAYFVILDKKSKYFSNIKDQGEAKIIEIMLKKLVLPRLRKNRDESNHFIFEEKNIQNGSLQEILNSIFSPFENYDLSFKIVDKQNINLAIVDYFNYLIFNIYKNIICKKKSTDQEVFKFNLLKEKIGFIEVIGDDFKYLSRLGNSSNSITLENLK